MKKENIYALCRKLFLILLFVPSSAYIMKTIHAKRSLALCMEVLQPNGRTEDMNGYC